jgi:FAD binding domain
MVILGCYCMVERSINPQQMNFLPMLITEEILDQFAAALGPKGFTRDAETIAPWLSDWRGIYHGQAAAMLSPQSVAEVSTLVKIAAQHGVGLVPQGGNTSMVGGATPSGNGDSLIVSLRRMNQVRMLDAEGGSVIAADTGCQRVGNHRRIDRNQCRRHTGAALRHDA